MFFLYKKRIVGSMVIKWHFFKKNIIFLCKKRHIYNKNPHLRNGYYHRKNNFFFCVMIFRTSKKPSCKKTSKKHEHTFSHENDYDDFLKEKKQHKDHVVFSLKF